MRRPSGRAKFARYGLVALGTLRLTERLHVRMVGAEQVAVPACSVRIACARCEVFSRQTRVTTIEGQFHGDDYSRPKRTAGSRRELGQRIQCRSGTD
jgi:hypothetical protein